MKLKWCLQPEAKFTEEGAVSSEYTIVPGLPSGATSAPGASGRATVGTSAACP